MELYFGYIVLCDWLSKTMSGEGAYLLAYK